MIIHRDETMMYYIYIRKFDEKGYIGFAVAINGFCFTRITPLFSLFERKIEQLAERGILINYTQHGNLTTTLSSFVDEEEEVAGVVNILQKEFSSMRTVKRLPEADYGVSIQSQKIFNENDDNSEIVAASCAYGYTIILKQENYDTLRSTSYRSTLKQLNAQNEYLSNQVEELKETNRQIKQEKEQFRKVIFLAAGVIGCIIGIYFLHKNLNKTQDELDGTYDKLNLAINVIQERDSAINSKDSIISYKESVINNRNKLISSLKKSISGLENLLQQANNERLDLSVKIREISKYHPFLVTSCDVNSEKFKFEYYCPEKKYVVVSLKAINTRTSEIITSNHNFYVNEGRGSKYLAFSKKLNTSDLYYVVLIYHDQIIAGKYW